jgi:hypothetical protein
VCETQGAKRHEFEPKVFKNKENDVNILIIKIPRYHKYRRQYNRLSIPDLNLKNSYKLELGSSVGGWQINVGFNFLRRCHIHY